MVFDSSLEFLYLLGRQFESLGFSGNSVPYILDELNAFRNGQVFSLI